MTRPAPRRCPIDGVEIPWNGQTPGKYLRLLTCGKRACINALRARQAEAAGHPYAFRADLRCVLPGCGRSLPRGNLTYCCREHRLEHEARSSSRDGRDWGPTPMMARLAAAGVMLDECRLAGLTETEAAWVMDKQRGLEP